MKNLRLTVEDYTELKTELEFYFCSIACEEIYPYNTYESIYGQEIIPIDGEYLVFIACEYCGSRQGNTKRLCCSKCCAPLAWQGTHLTPTAPDQAALVGIAAQIYEFIYEQRNSTAWLVS